MKNWMLGLMMLLIGLFNRSAMAIENISWGNVKAQMTQEPAGKLVVTATKAGGPRVEITAISPPHLLSAGNGVVVDEFVIKAIGVGVMWFDFPLYISPGLTNTRMYLSDSWVQVGPTMLNSGNCVLPWRMNMSKGTTIRVAFMSDVVNSDGTVPPEGVHLSVDFLEGVAVETGRSGTRRISTPAAKGVGGDVRYPPACIGTGFSSIDGTPCIPETAE